MIMLVRERIKTLSINPTLPGHYCHRLCHEINEKQCERLRKRSGGRLYPGMLGRGRVGCRVQDCDLCRHAYSGSGIRSLNEVSA